MKKYLKLIFYLLKENYKTIYFNFKYFSFNTAIVFPVILSRNTCLKELKGKVIIEEPPRYGMIKIGFGDIGIFDKQKSRTILQIFGTLKFKSNAQIGHGSKISVGKKGTLIIGKNFKITAETAIASHKEIVFGDNCLLSWDILIIDSDFHAIRDLNGNQLNEPQRIEIGNNVWIGCRTTILKGTKIPDDSVIGASSLVNSKLLGENSIFAGIPAKLTCENIQWTNK